MVTNRLTKNRNNLSRILLHYLSDLPTCFLLWFHSLHQPCYHMPSIASYLILQLSLSIHPAQRCCTVEWSSPDINSIMPCPCSKTPHWSLILIWSDLISLSGLSASLPLSLGFPGGSDCKESTCSAGDQGSNPGLGRSPGEGNGCPLQYSCLKNPIDRGAWQATVHGVANSQTQLNN